MINADSEFIILIILLYSQDGQGGQGGQGGQDNEGSPLEIWSGLESYYDI